MIIFIQYKSKPRYSKENLLFYRLSILTFKVDESVMFSTEYQQCKTVIRYVQNEEHKIMN